MNSQANKFSQLPFNRFGNGPDLAGLFCGDNGIFGVKTKVSLQVFPKPKFAAYKTPDYHRKILVNHQYIYERSLNEKIILRGL